MEKTLQFKTNINCGGCIAKIKPSLDTQKEISNWDVDTNSPNKTLTINTLNLTAQELMEIVNAAGFKAEPLITTP